MIEQNFLPGGEWFYLKLYTGRIFADQVLGDILFPLFNELETEYKIDTWFFVRYSDPYPHIRLRFRGGRTDVLRDRIKAKLLPYTKRRFVWKVEIGTYEREIERYTKADMETCEKLFANESKLIIWLLNQKYNQDSYMVMALSLIERYVQLLFDKPEQRSIFLANNFKAFQKEFSLDRQQLHQLNKKYDALFQRMINHDLVSMTEKSKQLKEVIKNQAILVNSLKNRGQVADSLIHMMVNRLFHSNMRAMEMVVYHHLEKLFRYQENTKNTIVK